MTTSSNEMVSHALWPQIETQLLRAELLLERSIHQLDQGASRQQQQKAGIALGLEQILSPLQKHGAGLADVIESMAADRQDNRSQRWQGQLQELLIPIDSVTMQLQELLLQLESTAPLAPSETQQKSNREPGHRLQLQQLLALRQRQVLQLQAEVKALRQQLFNDNTANEEGNTISNESTTSKVLPSIFGS